MVSCFWPTAASPVPTSVVSTVELGAAPRKAFPRAVLRECPGALMSYGGRPAAGPLSQSDFCFDLGGWKRSRAGGTEHAGAQQRSASQRRRAVRSARDGSPRACGQRHSRILGARYAYPVHSTRISGAQCACRSCDAEVAGTWRVCASATNRSPTPSSTAMKGCATAKNHSRTRGNVVIYTVCVR